jgi:NTP pyrophosphatase (non-canonical NTP hydrolase)
MRSDVNTTIAELKEVLRRFRDKRDWAQFHDPKNLAEAISIEAAELLQLFLWKDRDTVLEAMKTDRQFRVAVEEELADVFCFGLNLANSAGIDISQIIKRKIRQNNAKYPVVKSKGVSTKYDKL